MVLAASAQNALQLRTAPLEPPELDDDALDALPLLEVEPVLEAELALEVELALDSGVVDESPLVPEVGPPEAAELEVAEEALAEEAAVLLNVTVPEDPLAAVVPLEVDDAEVVEPEDALVWLELPVEEALTDAEVPPGAAADDDVP